MKKLTALLVCALLSLTGCGIENVTDAPAPTDAPVTTAAPAPAETAETAAVTETAAAATSDTAAETAFPTEKGTARFLENGMFIYDGAVYTQPWYAPGVLENYGSTTGYFGTIYPDAKVSVCIIPCSAIRIDDPDVQALLTDQGYIFTQMSAIIGKYGVNFVDTYGEMYAHRSEYTHFKTDHHWTQRGAYYAYKAFVESIGLTATPLEDFERVVITEDYHGSLYGYTGDEEVLTFSDTVEAFFTKKALTMTVTDQAGGTAVYPDAIAKWSESYSAFLYGDNPYTVINVPENPQDKNVLVFKDSYGNAMVPFLAENFGNIIVVDTRYNPMNVAAELGDYPFTDVLFINNLEAANSQAWYELYMRAAGLVG
ncbi:MAG: DHHW family protein [Clostridia bacterium]|nr:DHHW family protein [Clostridia bacterium]